MGSALSDSQRRDFWILKSWVELSLSHYLPSCPGRGGVNSTQLFSPMNSSKISPQVVGVYWEQGEVGWANVWKTQGGAVPSNTNSLVNPLSLLSLSSGKFANSSPFSGKPILSAAGSEFFGVPDSWSEAGFFTVKDCILHRHSHVLKHRTGMRPGKKGPTNLYRCRLNLCRCL